MGRKVLLICACGRREGFTYAMCSEAEAVFKSEGWDVETLYPIEMNIGHCTGCGICKNHKGCVLDDDMESVYESFENAELLLICSPIHYSGVSSVMKTVIDRFQTLWYSSGKGPEYMAAMMSGGHETPEFRGAMHVFKAFAITAGSEWIDELQISDTDRKDYSDVEKESRDFISSLISKLKQKSVS